MEIGNFPAMTVCQTRDSLMSPDIVVGQQPARHVCQDDCARLTVLSCVYPATPPVHLSRFFSFYCIPVTTIKDADDTPLSQGERVSDARIIFPQSDRTSDTETLQSLSDEAHTASFPSITQYSGTVL